MKRLLSFLLITVLIIGCIPAVPVFAASGVISVESVEIMEGASDSVDLKVSINDNPGISYVKLAVVYSSAKLCKGDDENAFASTIFSADMGSVGSERIGTHRDIKNYIPADLTVADAKGFVVEIESEDGSNVYDDGIIVSLPLTLVDPVPGDAYTVYVSVVEIYNEDGDEVVESGTMVTGTVSIKADELLNAYESFTIFTSPENSTIPYGTESFDVDVRICQNPGIWAARFYVVYPDSLSLDNGNGSLNVENSGAIFTSLADFTPGIPDLSLDDSKQVAAFKKIVEDKGLTIEGYKSSTLYFQNSSSVDEVLTGNGVLATLHFTVLESARIGDILDIKIYYAEDEDFLWAGTSDDGMPVFETYNPATVGSSIVVTNGDACGHINVTTDRLEATCTEDGYEKTVCNDCGYVTVEKAIPATGHSFALGICTNCGEKDASIPGTGEGFTVYLDPAYSEIDASADSISLDFGFANNPGLWSFRVYVVYPDSLSLDNGNGVGNVDISGNVFTSEDFTSGIPDLALDDSRLVYTFKKIIQEKGLEIEGYSSTVLYFENSKSADEVLTGDGIVATLNFAVSDAVKSGDILDIKIYYGEDEDFLWTGNTEDGMPFFETYNPEVVNAEVHVLGGAEECPHTNCDVINNVEPTCTEDGYFTVYCIDCGEIVSEEIIPAYGHKFEFTYNTETVWPTCTKDGYVAKYCDNCGERTIAEILPATGHDEYGAMNITPATCEGVGKNEYTCSMCGQVSRSEIIPAFGHNYENGECVICHKIAEAGSDFKVVMSPESASVSTNPDDSASINICFENSPGIWSARMLIVYPDTLSLKDSLGNAGIYNAYELFPGADDMIYGIVDLPLGDSRLISEYKQLIERMGMPTDGYSCTVIYFEQEYYNRAAEGSGLVASLDFHPTAKASDGDSYDVHLFYSEYDFLSASLGSDGTPVIKYYEPVTKGATVDIGSCGHVNTFEEYVYPNCTENGYSKIICNDCGLVVSEKILDAYGHNEDYEYYLAPTCAETGLRMIYCTRCWTVVEEEIIDKLEHVIAPGDKVTCEKDLLCYECGAVIQEAPGHEYVDGVCVRCERDLPANIVIDSITVIEGTKKAFPAVRFEGSNRNVAYLKFVVFYDNTKIKKSEESADIIKSFVNSIYHNADCDYGPEYSGTSKELYPYLPEGVNPKKVNGLIVELTSYEETDTSSGIIAELPLLLTNPYPYDDYSVYVTPVEAYDLEGNYIACSWQTSEGVISIEKDPEIGIYGDFTVFTSPSNLYVGEDADTFDLDLRFDANPGIWAGRMYVVYPAKLSLADGNGNASVENSFRIFDGEYDMNCGYPDLRIDDSRLPQYFRDMVSYYNPDDYRVLVLYFEDQDSYDGVVDGNGVLATLHFTVDGAIHNGDLMNIELFYGYDQDFVWAGTDSETGTPLFEYYNPSTATSTIYIMEGDAVCTHRNVSHNYKDPTCTEYGYDEYVCNDCGFYIVRIEFEPYGHNVEGRIEYVEGANCTEYNVYNYHCSVCDEVVVTEEAGYGPHVIDKFEIQRTTCTENGIYEYRCTYCGYVERTEEIIASGPNYRNPGNVTIWDATCEEDGYKTIKCDNCDETKVEVIPAYGHDEDVTETVAGTCMEPNRIVYKCSLCGEAQREEITGELGDHFITYYEAIEATCHQSGRHEFWMCEICQMVWSDENLRIQTNVKNLTIPAICGLVYVEGYEAVCHQTGMMEYWYCPDCDAVFTDAAGIYLTNRKNLTIPAVYELAYSAAVEPTCHQNGYGEYWYCPDCDAVFADAAGTQLTNRKNLEIAALTVLIHVDAVAPSCHQAGVQEFWACAVCEAVFSDAAGIHLTNLKNLTIPADSDLVYVEGYEASCHQTGMSEYWYCPDCDAVFADAAGTMLTNRKNLTLPAIYDLQYVAAVDATCVTNGCSEYWYCPECDAVFADAAGNYLTNRKNLTIPAYGHSFEDGKCTNCGETDPDWTPDEPEVPEYVRGDLDGDGVVTSKDINISKKLLSGAVVPTAAQKLAGDVNGDGVFNGLDGNILTKIAAGKM